MTICNLAVNIGRKMNGGKNNPYFPIPAEGEDVGVLETCKRIARKLQHVDYTLNDVKSIWRRSRMDAESLEILMDLTSLTNPELRYVLGIGNKELVVPLQSISCYYASEV